MYMSYLLSSPLADKGSFTQNSEATSSNRSRESNEGKSQRSAINRYSDTGDVSADQPTPLLTGPPPLPTDTTSCTESSDLSDDDNVNVGGAKGLENSATDYDNMYSTDYGTYNSNVFTPSGSAASNKGGIIPDLSTKFVAKLEQMQASDCNVRELYSELESDAADCESLVGDTDYETESGLHPPLAAAAAADFNHPLQKLQWTENRLLALLKPQEKAGAHSTVGSTLRHCRSLEMLPCENEDDNQSSQKHVNGTIDSQNLDNISMLSSLLGNEMSRSDPYLSDCAAYESEYDNYERVRLLSQGKRQSQPINNIDPSQFANIDFDKIKINEAMTTDDYIQSLQQHIDGHNARHIDGHNARQGCTDV